MSLCAECREHFTPDDYLYLCNSCGGQILSQFESMQEWRVGVLTIAELSGRVVFGEHQQPERCWVVG
jgi:hypothetical protein